MHVFWSAISWFRRYSGYFRTPGRFPINNTPSLNKGYNRVPGIKTLNSLSGRGLVVLSLGCSIRVKGWQGFPCNLAEEPTSPPLPKATSKKHIWAAVRPKSWRWESRPNPKPIAPNPHPDSSRIDDLQMVVFRTFWLSGPRLSERSKKGLVIIVPYSRQSTDL